MQRTGARKVQDKDGREGTVVSGSPPLPSNAAQVVVQTESGQQLLVPTALLVQQPDGSYALPLRLAACEHPGSEPRVHQAAPMVVPVLVEELEVHKRPVETGTVRLTKVVHEHETTVDEPLWHDQVAITRVPIQRVVEGPVPVREEQDTTIISVVEEVLVVEKRWMLREEIHIRQHRIATHQPQRITLRSEDVQVERVPHAHAEIGRRRRMAKTLVALYDTCTDAEQVMQELIDDGYARHEIHLALDHTRSGGGHAASGGGDAAYEEAHLTETLVDLGVPYDEVQAYREGVRRGGALVVVESRDERAARGMEILRRLHPVDIHARTAQWRHEGWTGDDAPASTSTPPSSPATATRRSQEQARSTPRVADEGAHTRCIEGHDEVAIPVVHEDLTIGTREVERGHVRIDRRVTEQPAEEVVRLREEKVIVERRPVDRPATDADLAAAATEVMEITETAEEAVVTKRARVVEEVVVHKEVTEHTETVRETVRHTDVDVQREPETATAITRSTAPQDFAPYDALCRTHYATAFADKGGAYTEYEPAYRYGYEVRTNERYRGRDWAAVEAEARSEWELRHPSTWERFKDAIHYGWESLTGNGTARPRDSRTVDRTDFTTYRDDFHTHYVTAFGDRGTAYIDYEPAYRYGYELGTNECDRGRDWNVLEADARREWEARYPTTWERFKDAIHYGWDKVRAQT